MTFVSGIAAAGVAFEALVDGLRLEFGSVDVGGIAHGILEAEQADFHWAARVRERYLGQYLDAEFGLDPEVEELDRVAFVSVLEGQWHAGVVLVNGEGAVQDLLWVRSFKHEVDALDTYLRAH